MDVALWSMTVKHKVISFTTNHTKMLNHSRESAKPSSSGLLKTTKRFTKTTDKAKRLPLGNNSRRFLHIDFFEVTMEEGILDVKLMKWPMPHSNHRQKEKNRGHLGNKGESVAIVQTKDLSVPFGDNQPLICLEQERPVPKYHCFEVHTFHQS